MNLFKLPAETALPALIGLRQQVDAQIEVLRWELAGAGRWPVANVEPSWDTTAVIKGLKDDGHDEHFAGCTVDDLAEHLPEYCADPDSFLGDEFRLIDLDRVDWHHVARAFAA